MRPAEAEEIAAIEEKPPKRPRKLQGSEIVFDAPEPWSERVNARQILDEIADFIDRFVILPPGGLEAVALWSAFSWVVEAFNVAPMLAVSGPTRRCGKTRLAGDILGALVSRPLLASNISPAALFRVIEKYAPTLLIDEAETFVGASRTPAAEELRGVLNSGHSRATAFAIRAVKANGGDFDVRRFNTFGPKAFALIGELPQTLADRSIVIQMRRRGPEEMVEPIRRDQFDAEAARLRSRVARWAEDAVEDLRDKDPRVPARLDDRAADNWRPLLAIGDVAGGDWPDRARQAAEKLSEVREEDEGDLRLRLLEDIRTLFHELSEDFVGTDNLVERLLKLPEAPWGELGRPPRPVTAHRLGRMLRPFGIKSTRESRNSIRGYLRSDFAGVWDRYLATSGASGATDGAA